MSENRLDAAGKLFEAAYKSDPADNEPKSGLKVVAKLKDGEITREQLRKQLSDPKQFVEFTKGGEKRISPQQLAMMSEDAPPPPPANPPVTGPVPAPPRRRPASTCWNSSAAAWSSKNSR